MGFTINSISQVHLLITKKEGGSIMGELTKKTADSFFIINTYDKEEITLSYSEINKIQTMGVHFIKDGYTNELSNNTKILEYDKFGRYKDWNIYLSTRLVNSKIFLLFKFKWISEDKVSNWPVIKENELITIKLSDGSILNLKITDSYILEGICFYNFGYVTLNEEELKQLLNSPIDKIEYRDSNCRVGDDFVIMRHLYAIIEEDFPWE